MKKKILIGLGILIVLIALVFLSGGNDKVVYETAIVARGSIVEEVNVTGRVEPSKRVDLAFEKTGKVARVYVSVGDVVAQGDILISLVSSDVQAELAQARAQVKYEQAKLNILLVGAREEEIAVQKIKVQNAQTVITEINDTVDVALDTAFTKADDAISNRVDQFINNSKTSTPTISFSTSNYQLETKVEQGRVVMQEIFMDWKSSLLEIDYRSSIALVRAYLLDVKVFLDDVAVLVNALSETTALSQTTIDGYKDDISTARTNIDSALSTLIAAGEELANAESAFILAEKELVLILAPATVTDIAAQSATLEEARAGERNYVARLAKTVIHAPIQGVVTVGEAAVGEIITAGEVLISIITESAFKIEARVPEADIAQLTIGDIARVTLDAYGDETLFEATIVAIEPAENIIDGVATYKTTFAFNQNDNRIKSGMTANIDVVTDLRDEVLYVPARSVLVHDNQKIVRVLEGGVVTEVAVITGLRDINGNIEIIEGLPLGAEIVVFIID